MSYLLDALRKSERERALGNVPNLGTVSATTARRGHHWASWIVVPGMLVILAAVAVWFVLRPELPSAASPAASLSAAPTPSPVAVPSVPRAAPPITAAVATPEPEPDAQQDAPPETSVSPATSGPLAATATRAEPAATTASAPRVLEYAELAPQMRAGMPEMRLNVVAFSDEPSRRFVMIDFARYLEGQTVAGAATVQEITPDGAILSYRGQRFFLRP